ncbi:hypothetical protein QCA50_004844 [Cerrena zonata]|uniref:Protein kinase domain-containing protein n=1 Tax=Cerrena zonata TaxID=2478898 RepID=A0AAW0GJV9_9APHY
MNADLPSYAFCTPERAEYYAKETEEGHWSLLSYEVFWRERCVHLKSRGYLLRPRFHPGWVPSWLGTNRDPDFCEDSIRSMESWVIDATRSSDESRVMIKLVSKTNNEVPIASLLSTPELLQDPTNHCVPIFDVLDDPLEPTKALLVMPYLRPFDDPEFRTIGEVVDFVSQTLEGLVFIHKQNVAHRDCAARNIMMDGRLLFPQGHHPVRLDYLADGVRDAPCLNRQDHPVRYYFIDFGISSHFKEGDSLLVLGTKGRDKDPPELSEYRPYNPFPLDVFILGNVYLKEFVEKYYGLEFLHPLISSMTHPTPEQRPTIDTAYKQFQRIQAGLSDSTLRWRLRSRKESVPERVVYDTVAVARESLYRLKRIIV